MAKLLTYVFITVGIMVLFNIAGLQTAGSYVVNTLGINTGEIGNFRTTALWITFAISAIAALAGAAIVMGILGRGSAETAVAALYATPLLAFIGEMIAISVQASSTGSWVGYLVFLIMSPLIVSYTITLFDWVRGRD